MTRLHIMVPQGLAEELDRRVGKRGRSSFITKAMERELRRLRLVDAIEDAAGELAEVETPGWETPEAVAEWVTALRRESDAAIESPDRRSHLPKA
jgi:hypothetical protein